MPGESAARPPSQAPGRIELRWDESSSTAEGSGHHFVRGRRFHHPLAAGLILKGPGEGLREVLEELHIPGQRLRDTRVHQMISRNKRRIDRSHTRDSDRLFTPFKRQPASPVFKP